MILFELGVQLFKLVYLKACIYLFTYLFVGRLIMFRIAGEYFPQTGSKFPVTFWKALPMLLSYNSEVSTLILLTAPCAEKK